MQIERHGLYDSGTLDGTMPGGNRTWRRSERVGLRSPAAVSSGIEAEPFHIDVYLERETARVAPVGELDLATVTRLRERRNEVWASGCRSVVLDLRGLTFIDSSGLHLILEWDSEARETGMEFTVIHGPPAVRRVLDITGLLDWLPFRAMAGSVSPHSRARGQAAGAAAPAR